MTRRLLILAGALICLWGVWYVYSSSERATLSVNERTDFFWVDTLRVDSAAVKYADWTHLAKRNGKWYVERPAYSWPADEGLLSRILETTNNMVLENVISTNAVKFEKFQVDTTYGRVLRFFSGGTPLAEFVIGKLGAGSMDTYVRQFKSDSVFLARGQFQQLFTMMPDQWKSRVVFDVDSSEVDTIRWICPDGETRLARGADRVWTVWETGKGQPVPADTAALNAKLTQLCPLRTNNFHPEGNPDVPTFDTLSLQLIVVTSDHRADTVVYSIPGEGSGKVYARCPGRAEPTFLFYKTAYDKLIGRYDDLVSKDTTAPSS
jgi:hypothetical protein